MQFTEYKLVPLVRGILTSALLLLLREILADLSNADAKRTIADPPFAFTP